MTRAALEVMLVLVPIHPGLTSSLAKVLAVEVRPASHLEGGMVIPILESTVALGVLLAGVQATITVISLLATAHVMLRMRVCSQAKKEAGLLSEVQVVTLQMLVVSRNTETDMTLKLRLEMDPAIAVVAANVYKMGISFLITLATALVLENVALMGTIEDRWTCRNLPAAQQVAQ